MLIDRKEAPATLLTAAELRCSGSVRNVALAGTGLADAADRVWAVPTTTRTAVASKTVRRCCNIKTPQIARCGHPGGQGLTPDVGDVRNFGRVLQTPDFRGFFRLDCAVVTPYGMPEHGC